MRRLIYISKAAAGTDFARIEAIVSVSVARNTSVGITGVLWFDGANFAQVLEGGRAMVGETMDRVARDPRHRGIEIVQDRQIEHRMFNRWAMMLADDSESAIMSTSFLVGYARTLTTNVGHRLYEIALASAC